MNKFVVIHFNRIKYFISQEKLNFERKKTRNYLRSKKKTFQFNFFFISILNNNKKIHFSRAKKETATKEEVETRNSFQQFQLLFIHSALYVDDETKTKDFR